MPTGYHTKKTAGAFARSRWGLALVALMAPAMARSAIGGQSPAPAVTITRIDGTTVNGRWLGAGGATSVRIATETEEVNVPLDEIASAVFTPAYRWREPAGDAQFFLADGGRLGGLILEPAKDAVVAETGIAERVALPFARLAAVRLGSPKESPKAAALFESALAERLPGKDLLITRDSDEAKTVHGRLESLGPSEGSFVFGDRVRTFQVEKAYGIVFASGGATKDAGAMLVNLISGESLGGQISGSDSSSIKVAASFDAAIDVTLDRVADIQFRSDRVVYLSDLKPTSEKTEGRLHLPWPIRLDQSVAAGPLAIGGRRFERGLGMHSRAEITYALDGKYESFAATIGLDDAVRPAGSVTFRVLGDGKTLFDSELLTGADEPRDILVAIKGVRQLTLIADYGDELDLSDYANWGGARLLRLREAARDSKSF